MKYYILNSFGMVCGEADTREAAKALMAEIFHPWQIKMYGVHILAS